MLKGFSGVAILLILLGVVVILTLGFETTDFATGAGEKAFTALGTLLIIALFVERAQQVYIVAWRGLERSNIDTAILHAREDLAAAEKAAPVDPGTVDAAKKTLQTQTAAQETYRAETHKIVVLITDFLDKTREGFKSQQSGATGT